MCIHRTSACHGNTASGPTPRATCEWGSSPGQFSTTHSIFWSFCQRRLCSVWQALFSVLILFASIFKAFPKGLRQTLLFPETSRWAPSQITWEPTWTQFWARTRARQPSSEEELVTDRNRPGIICWPDRPQGSSHLF